MSVSPLWGITMATIGVVLTQLVCTSVTPDTQVMEVMERKWAMLIINHPAQYYI